MVASCYIEGLFLLTIYISCGVVKTSNFYIFWKYKANSSECVNEEKILKDVVHYPYRCHQSEHDKSSPMTVEECVAKIKCANKDIDMKTVAHCSNKEGIVCCLNTNQCTRQTINLEKKETCYFVDKKEFKRKGECHFPFIYNGKAHYQCTVAGNKDCRRWCSTLTDKSNVFKTDMWEYCDNKCPVKYSETCKKKGEFPMFIQESVEEKEKGHITPRRVERSETCRTTNTTTRVKNKYDGKYSDFSLINPKNCLFPFNYKGKWYTHCIALDDPLCRFWCSIKNDHGYHRKYGSQWAYCKESGCNLTTTDNHGERLSHDVLLDAGKKPKCTFGRRDDLQNHFYEWENKRFDYIESDDANYEFEDDDEK